MGGRGLLSPPPPDQVVAELTQMGFEKSAILEAVKQVGPSVEDAVDFILGASSAGGHDHECPKTGKASSSGHMRQSSILDHFQSGNTRKRVRPSGSRMPSTMLDEVCHLVEGRPTTGSANHIECCDMSCSPQVGCLEEVNIVSDWEQRANGILRKHFGYQSLKSFQKEALAAWLAHRDCLVLAATGSGKSLCFQIPALLTGKIVVVISPLISLMHDQCLKLSKHGVSACFLGSGQPDSTVEKKAMTGMYDILYVCPETLLRLIKPLQSLAEKRGIALFAIDEVHCVSKWGHDFRPDYRRLFVLRECFSSSNLKFLKFDVPIMALTATATIQVREDIVKSLRMSADTKIVLTSFFRPNLQFSVKHSKTSSSSYEKDFRQLVDTYVGTNVKTQRMIQKNLNGKFSSPSDSSTVNIHVSSPENTGDDFVDTDDDDGLDSGEEDTQNASGGKVMSVEYLENDVDVFGSVDDWDVACGEFYGERPNNWDNCGSPKIKPEEKSQLMQEPLEGPTIIYVPTRKETLSIANYLCGRGVKAAAYNAGLRKSHLRQVHKEFQGSILEVVVATIAFGMGIDKSNIRKIIHYGWPQSLEAYYQEVGRAGRDGKLAECILFANLSRVPSLLPSKRSEAQKKLAYRMLSDFYRYGMNTSNCRAKILVEYFGEEFSSERCLVCDVCIMGAPKLLDVKQEADVLMQIVAASHSHWPDGSYDDGACDMPKRRPNLREFVSKIKEQSQKFWDIDQLWWRGLARMLEDKGYIKEADAKAHVQIKCPEPTKMGLEFVQYERQQPFLVCPEADMLLAVNRPKEYSSFADWGKGWADPELRRQRLERKQATKKPRKQRQGNARKLFKRIKPDQRTARGRIAAKLIRK